MRILAILIFTITSLVTLNLMSARGEHTYPKAWFKEVPKAEGKWWEILPQEAKKGEVILSKRTELGVFSNFAETPVEIDGVKYKSLEGFWQMMKYPEGKEDPRNKAGIQWDFTRDQVAQMTSFEAKKAGDLGSKNMKALGINWVSYQGRRMDYRSSDKGEHYNLIYRAMWEKLKQNPKVLSLLLKTGDLKLRPDHKQGKNPPPAWKYHEIYMEMRAKLRKDPSLIQSSL